MTNLAELNKYGGGGDKLPGFAFKRIGDSVKGTVIRSALVDVPTDNGTRTKLVIELDVLAAKGGIPNFDADGILTGVSDYQPGDKVAVWLPSGYGIGAITQALAAAGTDMLADGATLTVTLESRKDTGKAKPANVYAATYVAPVGGSAASDLDPFA